MWDIVWVSLQGHRSVSVSRHFLLQAPQCPCSVRKRFSRDYCCSGRSKPGCRIVGSHTRWQLTISVDFQLCLHWLLMSTGCKSSHSGLLDVSRRRHLVKGNNKCRTVFKENLTETSLTALNVSTILACTLSLLPISLRLITSSFSQNYLQTLDHVILPQFFLFALFIPSSAI